MCHVIQHARQAGKFLATGNMPQHAAGTVQVTENSLQPDQILGETFEASIGARADIFVEQISHHPPISSWEVVDQKRKVTSMQAIESSPAVLRWHDKAAGRPTQLQILGMPVCTRCVRREAWAVIWHVHYPRQQASRRLWWHTCKLDAALPAHCARLPQAILWQPWAGHSVRMT